MLPQSKFCQTKIGRIELPMYQVEETICTPYSLILHVTGHLWLEPRAMMFANIFEGSVSTFIMTLWSFKSPPCCLYYVAFDARRNSSRGVLPEGKAQSVTLAPVGGVNRGSASGHRHRRHCSFCLQVPRGRYSVCARESSDYALVSHFIG